jgi:hypothetical protein
MVKKIEDIKVNINKKIILSNKDTSFNSFVNKKEKGDSEKKIKIEKHVRKQNSYVQRLSSTPSIKKQRRVISKTTLTIFIIVVIIGGFYWGSDYLQKANIEIVSKRQNIEYNKKQFLASKDDNMNSVDFEIMIVSDKKEKSIVLTEPKDVSEKSKGTITLFNEFTTTPQKLLAGTFLADTNGKTYKIDNTINIPGYKLDSKNKIIPGQVVVSISAFLPGEAYNGSPTDFHITSFKGTAKYNKIYGKLKSPISGGASGLFYVLNDGDKNKIKIIAESSFRDDLINKVKALVPPGYILYKDAMDFSYKIEDSILSKTPETNIEIEGVLSVIILNEKSLINNILKTSLNGVSKEELQEIKISDLNNLSFNFVNNNQIISKDVENIMFYLNGKIEAIWVPDIEILKTKLQGVKKVDVLQIFRQDKGISSALVKIFPPWQKNIPNDISKINILVK